MGALAGGVSPRGRSAAADEALRILGPAVPLPAVSGSADASLGMRAPPPRRQLTLSQPSVAPPASPLGPLRSPTRPSSSNGGLLASLPRVPGDKAILAAASEQLELLRNAPPEASATTLRPATSDPVAGVAALSASPVAASRPPPLPLQQQHGTVRTTLAAAATLARLGLLSPGLDPSANRGSSPLVHHQLSQQTKLREPPLAIGTVAVSGTVGAPGTRASAAGRCPSVLIRSRSSAALGEGGGAILAGAVGGWVSSRAAPASDDVADEAAMPVARGDAATRRSPAQQQLPWQRQQELR